MWLRIEPNLQQRVVPKRILEYLDLRPVYILDSMFGEFFVFPPPFPFHDFTKSS